MNSMRAETKTGPSTAVPSAQNLAIFGLFFCFLRFFLYGPFYESLLNLLQYCCCFMFSFSGHKAYEILFPRPGIEPMPLVLEGEVLTTGPPRKSLDDC